MPGKQKTQAIDDATAGACRLFSSTRLALATFDNSFVANLF